MNPEFQERRKDNLEGRVRDLEENDRRHTAEHVETIDSIAVVHARVGDLNVKVDMILSRMDEKAVDCAEHKGRLALMEQAHNVLTDTVKTLQAEQVWATRAAATGLAATLSGMLAYMWKVTLHKGG